MPENTHKTSTKIINLDRNRRQTRGSKMSVKKKLLTIKPSLIVYGVLGIVLNFAPEPLLHYLIYNDFSSELAVILVCLIVILIVPLILEKRFLGTTRKKDYTKAYKWFFIGISLSSFFLALITFLRYPSTIASNSYSWLVGGNWIISGVSSALGSVVFFVASILWDTLIGLAFAILERLLT
ncbi:MAG: hypothetical protein ABSF24_10855 [Candidatus Bathyarchaeia archaeon]